MGCRKYTFEQFRSWMWQPQKTVFTILPHLFPAMENAGCPRYEMLVVSSILVIAVRPGAAVPDARAATDNSIKSRPTTAVFGHGDIVSPAPPPPRRESQGHR